MISNICGWIFQLAEDRKIRLPDSALAWLVGGMIGRRPRRPRRVKPNEPKLRHPGAAQYFPADTSGLDARGFCIECRTRGGHSPDCSRFITREPFEEDKL